jgi:hypothetical protein
MPGDGLSYTATAAELPKGTWTTNVDNSIKIKMSRVKFWANDLSFWYKKKSGFPKISDAGRADLKIHGERGLSLEIKLSPLLHPQESYLLSGDGSLNKEVPPHKSFLRIDKVTCDIDRISLSIRDSRHDFLYRLLAPWFRSYIRDKLIRSIEDQVAKVIFEADATLGQMTEVSLPESAQAFLGLKGDLSAAATATAESVSKKIQDSLGTTSMEQLGSMLQSMHTAPGA